MTSVNAFDQARFVCEKLSKYDYKKLVWTVKGDVEEAGDKLRLRHPVFVDCWLNERCTAQTTRVMMRVFKRAASAATVEEFVTGGGKVSSGLRRDERRNGKG
jgi:hypothetical protein